jgi:hypothetical protein
MEQIEVSVAHGRRSPAEEALRGGDFFCPVAPDSVPAVLLGDVASKSLAGDFFGTALQLMFHRMAGIVRSPAEILARLNAGLLHCTGSMTPSETFTGRRYRDDITVATVEARLRPPAGALGAYVPAERFARRTDAVALP